MDNAVNVDDNDVIVEDINKNIEFVLVYSEIGCVKNRPMNNIVFKRWKISSLCPKTVIKPLCLCC
jgi:hypothetical protein